MPFQKYQEVEARYQKPMPDLLNDLLSEHKTITAVARILGVRHETVFDWVERAGCRTVLRIECDATARESATNGKAGTT